MIIMHSVGAQGLKEAIREYKFFFIAFGIFCVCVFLIFH